MLVLGITNNDLAGACLLRDGEIVAAASEERFTRVKEHRTWPELAIDFVLTEGGVSLADLDHVAYGWHAGFDAERHLMLYVERITDEALRRPEGLPHVHKRIADELANDRAKRAEFDQFAKRHGLRDKVVLVDHHESHGMGAFVCSPFDDALVVTCDGRGDFQSLTISFVSAGEERVLQRETSVDSLGYFYGRITRLLGFRPNRHEGKITGLAANGDPERLLPLMRRMIDVEDGRLRARCGDYYQPSYDTYSDVLLETIAAEPPADVAAAAQRHLENLIAGLVTTHIAGVPTSNVCLGGGVFGNVKLNQRILECPGVDNIYVIPPMGDGGLPLHSAAVVAYRKGGHRYDAPSMALGPRATTDDDALAALLRSYPSLRFTRTDDPQGTLLKALEDNRVIGLYRGRMEFGPRALGRRSIVYRTDDPSMNDWLNQRLKRTEFMPFAPITAEVHAASCYVGWRPDHAAARFMTLTYDCTPEFAESCPAVVHVDGTARPQVVHYEDDPFLHGVLLSWHDRTGQAALVNTSFNKHEEPIVGSPRDALDAVADGVVDLLLVDDQHFVWMDDAVSPVV
jgi:carbamoyltransferase